MGTEVGAAEKNEKVISGDYVVCVKETSQGYLVPIANLRNRTGTRPARLALRIAFRPVTPHFDDP